MTYQSRTDFVGMFRSTPDGARKGAMPGLDFMVTALQRAGLLNVSFSGIPPMSNQATTAWFKPANPSYSDEGMLYLWDADMSTYMTATPKLFRDYLNAS